jgi:small subunit ribosomal protein S6
MAKPNTAGNKHAYEVCVIVDGLLDEKKATSLLDKYLEVITNDGGTVEKTDNWGRKKLAYEINKKTDGIYFVVDFTSTAATSDEFARRIGLEEDILRYKVFRNEA